VSEQRRPAGLTGLGAAQEGERFRPLDALGGRDVLLDSGLPTLLFVTVYSLNGQRLAPALVAALAAGAVLGVLRLLRRDPVQNVLAGFIGLAIAAIVAARTGKAEDVFLPGLLINLGYALAYALSILVRWPLLGVLLALLRGQGMGWRQDPVLLRAYSLASWVWVAMFVLRLAVKVPLYLAGDEHLVALGVAHVAMGWPLFFLCIWLSWLIISRATRRAGRSGDEGPGRSVAVR
jgi:hypothetical protein